MGTLMYGEDVHLTLEVGTSATELLPEDNERSFILVQNISDTAVFLAFGKDAALNAGIKLDANSSLLLDNAIFSESLSAIHGGTGNKIVLVTQG